MIRNIDINNEGCGNLDGLKACLDYPTCGYDNSDTLLIAGWILPSDPLNNNIQVIVKVEENNEQHEFNTIPGKIHEHARIYRLRSVAGSQILNFMS